MGRQINYYLELDGLLSLSERALSLGCQIVREDLWAGCVTAGHDIGLIAGEEHVRYYFHLPAAGPLMVETFDGKERLRRFACPCENAVIEAGFSRILPETREIVWARLFSSSGYYDQTGAFLSRPRCIDRVYSTSARLVKKLAPSTSVTNAYISTCGQERTYTRREYISPPLSSLIRIRKVYFSYTITICILPNEDFRYAAADSIPPARSVNPNNSSRGTGFCLSPCCQSPRRRTRATQTAVISLA